jgi:hypothetical protein
MDRSAGVARLVSDAVAHELANQMQPLLTALRAAAGAEPAQRAALLEMVREAVGETLTLSESLRRAAAAAPSGAPVALGEVLELALRALPAELAARVRCAALPPSAPAVEALPTVEALGHLIRHAALAAGPSGALQLALEEGAPPALVLRYGGPSPSRDDAGAARPLLGPGGARPRLSPHLALAAMICAEPWGPSALRVAQGDRSGRLELHLGAAP